ncbi:sulfotransferase [Pleurocapsa sp. PCC 7319]|uniref:sulfotransferase n=1 Tax=Pleurocapsa sp. PCC 7319 TaxID=118161 RepID=UPI000349B031|nr:sulfotransferase [Pleurocapsa sp. PCC 7319]
MSLKFVICGLEHSGTTLLSDIFRQVSGLDSGFEVGVLLGRTPKEFPNIQPFYSNMVEGWKIEADVLQEICNSNKFEDFYDNLKLKSKLISLETKYIFDKTPRYFLDLYCCYEKIKVPFIALYKDPRSLVYSDYKRSVKSRDFYSWYNNYKKPKLRYLRNIYTNSYLKWKQSETKTESNNGDILCLSLESICLNTRLTLEKIFDHVNFEFNFEYLMLKNLRYEHTRQPQISSRIPFEYLENLTKEQIAMIQKDFEILEDWFYY